MADDDPTAPVCSAYIEAGGVELRLEGPGVTGVDAYALWQKVYDTIGNTRNRVGSGSGFVAERQEPTERSPWIGEGGPKVIVPGFAPTPNPHLIKPPIEFVEAAEFSSPEMKRVDCFHPWPGCNCT